MYRFFQRALMLILFIIWNASIFAQKITNVRSVQDGNNINIFYSITKAKMDQTFDISVFYSTDGGKTNSKELKSVTGDVGKNISSGENKKIVWNVFQDVSELKGEIVFNVIAKPTFFGANDSSKNNYRSRIFFSTSNSLYTKTGFMLGVLNFNKNKYGFYTSIRTNFEKMGKPSGLTANNRYITNYDRQDQYYLFVDTAAKHPNFSFCLGGNYQVAPNLYAFSGLGYGVSSLFWMIEDRKLLNGEFQGNRWVKNTTWSKKGFVWEGGLMFRYKWFIASGGFSTLSFSRTYVFLGLGVAL